MITLPDPIFDEAQKMADSTSRNVQDVLADMITRNFQPFPVHENREVMLREIEAYKELHPQLVKQYKGKFVAIFQGRLVDHDKDPVALLKRIKENYPGQTVLQRKVEETPDKVLRFRSPRFLSNK